MVTYYSSSKEITLPWPQSHFFPWPPDFKDKPNGPMLFKALTDQLNRLDKDAIISLEEYYRHLIWVHASSH